MSSSDTSLRPGIFSRQRIEGYPDVLIQPLDTQTVEQSSSAWVGVGGAIAAHLQRSEEFWELSRPRQPEPVESGGYTALEAVSNWLLSSEENFL